MKRLLSMAADCIVVSAYLKVIDKSIHGKLQSWYNRSKVIV